MVLETIDDPKISINNLSIAKEKDGNYHSPVDRLITDKYKKMLDARIKELAGWNKIDNYQPSHYLGNALLKVYILSPEKITQEIFNNEFLIALKTRLIYCLDNVYGVASNDAHKLFDEALELAAATKLVNPNFYQQEIQSLIEGNNRFWSNLHERQYYEYSNSIPSDFRVNRYLFAGILDPKKAEELRSPEDDIEQSIADSYFSREKVELERYRLNTGWPSGMNFMFAAAIIRLNFSDKSHELRMEDAPFDKFAEDISKQSEDNALWGLYIAKIAYSDKMSFTDQGIKFGDTKVVIEEREDTHIQPEERNF